MMTQAGHVHVMEFKCAMETRWAFYTKQVKSSRRSNLVRLAILLNTLEAVGKRKEMDRRREDAARLRKTWLTCPFCTGCWCFKALSAGFFSCTTCSQCTMWCEKRKAMLSSLFFSSPSSSPHVTARQRKATWEKTRTLVRHGKSLQPSGKECFGKWDFLTPHSASIAFSQITEFYNGRKVFCSLNVFVRIVLSW